MGQQGEEEGAINGGEERAGLAAAPYDRWVLLRPAEGSARYKVRNPRFRTSALLGFAVVAVPVSEFRSVPAGSSCSC